MKIGSRQRLVACACVIALHQLLLGPIVTADAEPLFAVELDFGDIDENSTEPLSRSLEFHSPIVAGNFYSRTAFAAAEHGSLRASAHGNIFFPDMREVGSGTILNGTDAIAAFRLDDVIITGPGDSVETELNLHFSGGVSANAFARNLDGVGAEAIADASVSVNAVVNGVSFGGTQSRSSTWNVATGGGGSFFEDGILSGWGGGDLVLHGLSLPVGTPFVLVLSLHVSEGSTVRSSGFGGLPVERKAEALSSFASTLSFSLVGPVFNLPDGYTANSISGGIVNNRFVVPEPGTLSLIIFAFSALLLHQSPKR